MRTRTILTLVLLGIFAAGAALAQISPGKLARAHASIEGISNCSKCHELGKAVTPEKCLACHSSLKARIDAGKGFHSSDEAKALSCFKCHSDHHGFDFDLIRWKESRDQFQHDLTGYKLEGAHMRLRCDDCHKSPFNQSVKGDKSLTLARTLLGLDKACLSCHEDEHQKQLPAECLSCHKMDAWKPASLFAHEKSRYPLTGKHSSVECGKCHKVSPKTILPAVGAIRKKEKPEAYTTYKPIDFSNCTPCHQDVHKAKLGPDCQKCHSTASFKEMKSSSFDHSKTDYPLVGKHATVTCDKCHTAGKATAKIAFAKCRDCHRDDHRGEFAKRTDAGACESCHTVQGYLPTRYSIDDHQKSRYPLSGAHLATPCEACHTALKDTRGKYAKFAFDKTFCSECHKDIHNSEADKWMTKSTCDACHKTDDWGSVTFDHSQTRYPLEGRHKEAACSACHRIQMGPKKIVRLKPLSITCGECHKDVHQGQLVRVEEQGKTECNRCHTPAGWHWLRFDHNRDSRYKLDGAHIKVACDQCHKAELQPDGAMLVRYKPLGVECADCHSGKK